MEILPSSSSHVGGSMGGMGGGGDDDGNKDNRGKKPLLQQQKESQPSKPNKKTKGRRKIEIKPIESEQSRLSTFSKRRSGAYKKANDIATHCGAKVAIVGITPAERFFSYGNPNVESVVQRFLQQQRSGGRGNIDQVVDNIVDAHRRVEVEFLNMNQGMVEEQIEEEKQNLERLDEIAKPFMNQNPNPDWFDYEDEDEIPDALVETAFKDLHNARCRIAEYRHSLLRRYIMPPPPPQPPPEFFEYDEGGGGFGQPMQGGCDDQGMMMMDTNMIVDPSSSSSVAVGQGMMMMDTNMVLDPSSSSAAVVGQGMMNVSNYYMEDPSSSAAQGMMMMDSNNNVVDPSSSSAAAPVGVGQGMMNMGTYYYMEDPCSSSSAAPVLPAKEEVDEDEMLFRLFFGEDPPTPPGPF